MKRLMLAAAVLAVALSVPAAFAGGKGLPTTIGKGEGSSSSRAGSTGT